MWWPAPPSDEVPAVSRSHSLAVSTRSATAVRALLTCVLVAALLPLGSLEPTSASNVDHLVVSEVVTGGASASDEMIELYNPTASPLPLEGLELIYVTASGATISRRAAWSAGAQHMPPGSHILVANELGIYASIADALYAGGMAATGGSVALRIQGAVSAVDAVGWGNAASTWMEGTPAAVPPAGSSLERLPGGTAGSTTDTDANAADFAVRSLPDPQNSGSPPVPAPGDRTPTPTPGATATPHPTPAPTATPAATGTQAPTATPGAVPITIADARTVADGSTVTIEGVALTGSDFTDGGGYLADATGGIAVLLDGGSFSRGDRILVSGTVDDRFAQRTLRAGSTDVSVTGAGVDPAAQAIATGSVGEATEGRLVRIDGIIDGSPTTLSAGLAFDVDDGTGPVRVVVGRATGIPTDGWTDGRRVAVVGPVGQRDSSGTGTLGYRVQPRAAADVTVLEAPTPGPSATESPGPGPSSTPPPPDGVVSIASARAAAKNARVTVRGVVTLASGTVDAGSAVIQDATGAILLRLVGEAGSVSRGEVIEVDGVRSTKAGMESLRTSVAPRRLGTSADPEARALRTGAAAEASEALLVVVRGALVASARRASSGTVSFEIDDGSGALRVVLGAGLAADDDTLTSGTWIEVRGVLGQETTGAQALRGYRVWPRDSAEVRILAGPTGEGGQGDGSGATDGGRAAAAPAASLAAVGADGLSEQRVGATLVASAWPELGVGGMLWDGVRLVAVAIESEDRLAAALAGRAIPLRLELEALRDLRREPRPGIATVALGDNAADVSVESGPPTPPLGALPGPGDPPAWVSLVGPVGGSRISASITVDGRPVAVERACRTGDLPRGVVQLVGVGLADPPRLIVGCDGARLAPDLALAAAAMADSAPRPVHGSVVDGTATGGSERRMLAAGMLAIGAGILAVAAIATRRLNPNEPEDGSPVSAEDELPPAHPAPPLTLVRLPDEHAP